MSVSPSAIIVGSLPSANFIVNAPLFVKSIVKAALELFKFGQEEASKRGLILVDTKYEFGISLGKLFSYQLS